MNRYPEAEADRSARYAARDVIDKLGIKPGLAVRAVGRANSELLARVRSRLGRRLSRGDSQADIILFWPSSELDAGLTLSALRREIKPDGGIWVISAKKGGRPYLPDRILIPLGLSAGLVDNKICSVSDTQTAMRFVIRRRDRQPG